MKLSVIIPAFNEQENIQQCVSVISKILESRSIDFELIFVSDGSTDATFETINAVSLTDDRVRGIEFSRNFGKESAIFAGLSMALGDCAAVMDADLQHPPEILPLMYEKWLEGNLIVEGVKSSRGDESFAYKLSAGLFYRIMGALMHIDLNATSDFKLLDRKVIDTLLSLHERNTFFRALTFWTGYRHAYVPFEVAGRNAGKSKWSVSSLVRYAVNNTTSFSTLPLQMVTWMGWVSIIFAVILGIQTLIKYFNHTSASGFPTVILLLLLIGGAIMISLGIIGHYLGKIYEEVKCRPKYLIEKRTENIDR